MNVTGRQLRRERRRRQLTIAELAEATGVSASTIGRIENEKVTDSPNTEVLADYLGVGPAPEREPEEPDLSRVPIRSLLDEIARRAWTADQVLRDIVIRPGRAPGDLESDPDDVIHGRPRQPDKRVTGDT